MSFQSRKQKILKILASGGEASVLQIAQATSASEATIRRDLQVLADEGLICRTHGGAMDIASANLPPLTFAQKAAQNLDKKAQLCALAAREIEDGDTIFMDCGSTVFQLCQFLKSRRVRVITNSIPVIHGLSGTANSLTLIGGEYDQERQAVHGSTAVEHIRKYRADKAFIGTDGLSATYGLSAKSEREAEISQAMMKQARMVFLLCDASKIGQDAFLKFADCSEIDVLVTDAAESLVSGFREVVPRVLH